MQMMRARCAACSWVFDVASLPGPSIDVAHAVQRRASCPLCYHGKSFLAEPRALTADERVAKSLGMLGSASTGNPFAPEAAP